MSRFQVLIYCAAAVLLSGMSADAVACSDKLSIIGGGVTFEQFAAEHRGNIVLLIEPDSPLRAANEQLKLRQALQKAGHRVRTVESTAELATVLDKNRVDVVLVSWGEQDNVQQQLASRSAAPSMLKVAYKSDPNTLAAASRQGDCFILVTNAQDPELVHRVGELVTNRSKAGAQQCGASKPPTTST